MTPVVLRKATWAEVEALFPKPRDAGCSLRNCRIWADRYGKPYEDYQRLRVSLQGWPAERLRAVFRDMSRIEPRMIVTAPPRLLGLPMACIRFRCGRYGWIDGKHRANLAMKQDGLHAVLVIQSKL